MKKKKGSKGGTLRFIFAVIIVFIVSAGGSYTYFLGKFTFDSSFLDEIGSSRSEPEKKDESRGVRRLYEHEGTPGSTEVSSAAALAAAEDAARKFLEIYKVRLLDLYRDGQGILYVDCGDELKKNFKGDVNEELNMVSGLYRSLKTAIPELAAIKVLIGGREAETIGGHIDISRPVGEDIAKES